LASQAIDHGQTKTNPFDIRVLIVEDEAIIAQDVASMLENLGYSVAGVAASGEAALVYAETQAVDIVLMDIQIKGKRDGIDTAGELKELYRLPVVYMTAHTDDDTLARARATEPFGYIAKPLTPGDIKVALAIALQRHRLHWQAEERKVSLQAAVENLEKSSRELARSNNSLALLAKALSHDLQEPLHAISISSNLLALEKDIAATEKGREYLRAIKDGCLRLDTLMSALLDYFSASSLERKGVQPIQATGPLRAAMHNLSADIESSGARIDAPHLPAVLVHPSALMLIFQNLLANSIKFAGDRAPHIQVSAEREGDFWRFTVKDNGIGFDPAQSEAIFDLFARAHGRPYSGTGLGLAMCRRLVDEHGGRIWAESGTGEGAQFHFTIPAWFTRNIT